jgi:hypothetical protein
VIEVIKPIGMINAIRTIDAIRAIRGTEVIGPVEMIKKGTPPRGPFLDHLCKRSVQKIDQVGEIRKIFEEARGIDQQVCRKMIRPFIRQKRFWGITSFGSAVFV